MSKDDPLSDSAGDELSGLIRRARDGCDQATGELLERCRDYLLHVAGQGLSPELAGKVAASDAVQETLLDAQSGLRRFEGRTEPELLAWLRAILKHNLVDLARRYAQTGKRELSRERRLDSAIEFVSPDGTASQILAGTEEEQRLQIALQTLSPEHRQIVRLRNWDLLSFAEIGQAMNRSEEAARKLWSRAIQKLQQEFNRWDQMPSPNVRAGETSGSSGSAPIDEQS